MAKQNRTIVALASRIVANVNARIAADVDMKALAAECSELALADRAKIDCELVNYYAVQAGVEVKERSKGEAAEGRCSLVAVWARDEEKKLTEKSNRASVALSRARAILFADQFEKKAKPATKGKAEAKVPATPEAVFAGLEKIAALALKSGDKAQIKALKARTQAIFLMLASA